MMYAIDCGQWCLGVSLTLIVSKGHIIMLFVFDDFIERLLSSNLGMSGSFMSGIIEVF